MKKKSLFILVLFTAINGLNPGTAVWKESLPGFNNPLGLLPVSCCYAAEITPKKKKPAGVIIENNKFYQNVLAGFRIKGSIPLHITACEFSENGRGGMDIEKQAKVTITDSKIFQNRRGGINIEDAAEIKVENSLIFDNWRGGMRLQKEKDPADKIMMVELKKNRIYLNREGGIRSQPYPDGKIKLTLLNNEIFENDEAGVRIENQTQLTARHNRIHHNGTAGIIAHDSIQSPTLDIYQNTLNFNFGPGIHIYTGINGEVGIRNNWIYDNQRSGIILGFRETLFNRNIDIDIIHNTIVGNGSLDQGAGVRNDSNGQIQIINNIIAYNYVTGIRTSGCEDDYSYNLMYANGKVPNCCNDPYSAPFWVEKIQYAGCSGRGKGELITDPLFIDPDNYDFRLKENSPAINAATKSKHLATGPAPDTKDIGATGGSYADI